MILIYFIVKEMYFVKMKIITMIIAKTITNRSVKCHIENR